GPRVWRAERVVRPEPARTVTRGPDRAVPSSRRRCALPWSASTWSRYLCILTGTPPAVTVSLLTRMLVEAFEGPPGPWTYFTDASPGTGIFATLGRLNAAQAS